MPAIILDGTEIASEIVASLIPRRDALIKAGKTPRLVVIRANDNPGSASYAKATGAWCEENGIAFALDDLGPDADEYRILDTITKHNANPNTTAMMLHMPLPKGCDAQTLFAAMDPRKDVEGMHPANLGQLFFGEHLPGPCTALGAVELARRAVPDMRGKNAVVIGRSPIVGRPAALLLTALDATVTIVHTKTDDVAAITRKADIIIAATGALQIQWNHYKKALAAYKDGAAPKPETCTLTPTLTADMIREGAAVIDVGVNRVPAGFDDEGDPLRHPETGKLRIITRGDTDFDGLQEKAGFITSPKGGTGAMTNAMLLRNLMIAGESAL